MTPSTPRIPQRQDLLRPGPLTGEVPAAPRGRRRDHTVTAVVGLLLAPAVVALGTVGARMSADGRVGLVALQILVLVAVSTAAQYLFARRSSVGGLIGGLTALAGQAAVILSPGSLHMASTSWGRAGLATGIVLLTAATLLGGSWGMRKARRSGREAARLAAQLARNDRLMGVTPAAPPSRRRDHAVSLLVTALAVAVTFLGLSRGSSFLTGPGGTAADAAWSILSLVALTLGSALTARSSLGARLLGPLLVLASLPLLLGSSWPVAPLREAVASLPPDDPTGITVAATGALLTAVGWGAHFARREGRSEAVARRRAASGSSGSPARSLAPVTAEHLSPQS